MPFKLNIFAKAGTPRGAGYQWTAFDAPQVVVRWHDGHTGRLLYAEGISLDEAKKSTAGAKNP